MKGVIFLLLLLLVASASAENKVYALTFQGTDTGYSAQPSFAWNDCHLLDSVLRTEIGVDTIINLFGWGVPVRGQPKSSSYYPKYRVSFIDGRASVAKLDTVTSWLSQVMDTTDILFSFFHGHGTWEEYPPGSGRKHSGIDACPGDPFLWDTCLAFFLNRIPCKARFIGFNSCATFGKGNHPDSCGFASYLAINPLLGQLHRKTILFSAAGPQPKWAPGLCDDKAYQNSEPILGLENEWYNNNEYLHCEFLFHLLTGLNGGAEPSEYYSDSPPGFFFDSIDVRFGNSDNRISLGEAWRWIRNRNSRLGFEDCQIVDSGGLRERFLIWPKIEIADSLDALPIAFLPDTADTNGFIPIVRVKNLGLASSQIPVHLWIDTFYHQTRSKTIGPNKSDTLWFAPCSTNQLGWLAVRCSTSLAGDEKPSNNLFFDSIYIVPVGLAEKKPIAFSFEKIPTLMTRLQFSQFLSRISDSRLKVLDVTGRTINIKAAAVKTGIYFLHQESERKKLLIIN